MTFRAPALVLTMLAVIAQALVSAPAQAADYELFVKSKTVAITPGGNGKVAVKCHAGSTCRGRISFAHDTGTPRYRDFSVSAGKSAYVSVALHSNAPDNPNNATAPPDRDFASVDDVKLRVEETSPRRRKHFYTVRTETEVRSQYIVGDVAGINFSAMSDVKVKLVRELRGGNTDDVYTEDITPGSNSFRFRVSLGPNNSSSSEYHLRISGRDKDDRSRFWYWRGSDGSTSGGGRYLRDASTIRANKYDPFDAEFRFTSISGKVSNSDEGAGSPVGNAEVAILAAPPSYSINPATKRELDIPSCANVYGTTRTAGDGTYRVDFLPYTTSTNNRYMINAKTRSAQIWKGDGSTAYGSCHDVTEYRYSKSNLIQLGAAGRTNESLDLKATGNDVKIDGNFAGFKPTYQGDRWIRIREAVPGLKVLEAPVVAEAFGDSSLNHRFSNLPPGKFWVEVSRRTGCANWYPSKFPNNRAYFRGLDRYAENWKSFTTLRSLSGNANSGLEGIARRADPNPARGNPQNTIPGGYAGWMYREYCKAYSEGSINLMSVDGFGNTFTKSTTTAKKGAIVKGRVTRSGGRTNKEMLVRLSSSAGTRVLRTDFTDSKGYFYVAGLDDGTYTISVNSDSWRGIGRSFTGKHSITVKAGKLYNAGTLKFKS